MKRTHKKPFVDKKLLEEMLLLREDGWSFLKLGRKYECDHTSILYQCKKFGIKKGTPIETLKELKEPRVIEKKIIEIIEIEKPKPNPNAHLFKKREKTCKGLDCYEDYLRQDLLRSGSKAQVLLDSFKKPELEKIF